MDTPEYFLDESVRNADSQSLRGKALAEFAGKSDEEFAKVFRDALNGLESVLDEWASKNHLERRETWRDGPWTLWFTTAGEVHREPVDSVELLLGHVLPAKFVPLAELVAKVSNDDQLGFRTILASLVLRDWTPTTLTVQQWRRTHLMKT